MNLIEIHRAEVPVSDFLLLMVNELVAFGKAQMKPAMIEIHQNIRNAN